MIMISNQLFIYHKTRLTVIRVLLWLFVKEITVRSQLVNYLMSVNCAYARNIIRVSYLMQLKEPKGGV